MYNYSRHSAILHPAGCRKSHFRGGKPREDTMSTLNFEQIKKLKREFPYLDGLVPLDLSLEKRISCKVSVKVQVADGEMLFTKPSFCLPPHYIGTADNKFVGHRSPHVYVIGRDNKVIRRASWNYDHKDFFVKQVVGDGRDVTAVVLKVVYRMYDYIEDWYEKKLQTYVGAFSYYDYQVTIFKPPKKGFAKLVEGARLTSNVQINDLVGISLASCNNPEAKAAINVLDDLVRAFEKNVAPSLWKTVNKCRTHGMSAEYGATKMLVYAISGRVMITFQRGDDQFTIVGDESDHKRTGLQSMNCTIDQAKNMVQDVIDHWKNVMMLPEKSVQSDTDVFFG